MTPNEMEKEQMAEFFRHLDAHATDYIRWVQALPKTLVVNPDIIAQLSRVEGFYQRPELMAQVTMHSPIVRHFKLASGTVMLREDFDEKFYHFE